MARPIRVAHVAAVAVGSTAVAVGLKAVYGSSWLEVAAFVTGVVAVYLAAVERIENFPVGIVNVLLYAVLFSQSRLWADMTLQVVFFVLLVLGWLSWSGVASGGTERQVSKLRPWHWLVLAVGVAGGTAAFVPLVTFFKGAQPLLDTFLTVLSLVGQVLTNLKVLDNWIIWIVANIFYLPLYWNQKLVPTAVLYLLYLVLAVIGLFQWSAVYRKLQAAQ